jgi:hypothetical protein
MSLWILHNNSSDIVTVVKGRRALWVGNFVRMGVHMLKVLLIGILLEIILEIDIRVGG